VHGPDERAVAFVVERVAQLEDQVGEAAGGHVGVRPEPLYQLRLRHRHRRVLEQDLEEPGRPGTQVDGTSGPQQRPGRRVEEKVAEADSHSPRFDQVLLENK
jgi:hypothetical protein